MTDTVEVLRWIAEHRATRNTWPPLPTEPDYEPDDYWPLDDDTRGSRAQRQHERRCYGE